MELVKLDPPPSGRGQLKLRVGWESPSAVIREMAYLTSRQQAEVGVDYQPYAPNWEVYLSHERAGSCRVWTARPIDGKVLVGYVVWFFYRGMHNAETLFANADLVYLSPEWREGLLGYKLLKSSVDAVRPAVNIIRVETNDLYEGGRMGLLLERLKFRRIGSVYQRVVK